MTANEIVTQLEALGKDTYKSVLLKHGVNEPVFGVKIEEMKKILAKVRGDQQLALDLYDTGIYDAMYLAGLIADGRKMSKRDLQRWVTKSRSGAINEFTVPWVAAESAHGRELALDWIESNIEGVASSGWVTLSGLVAMTDDAGLDIGELKRLLLRVQKTIHDQPNRVRYVMNNFVIAVGSYVPALTDLALQVGAKMGPVTVDMGDTACKVPYAPDSIEKVKKRGALGKKRKTMKG